MKVILGRQTFILYVYKNFEFDWETFKTWIIQIFGEWDLAAKLMLGWALFTSIS